MARIEIDDVLNCPSLPSLPAVAVRMLELTSDPDVKMSEIARTVQQDQALAGKVLKTVNSSYYGLPNRCGSIERALGYLGLNTVKSLVLGFSLVEATNKPEHEGFDLMSHWRRTLMGAAASRTLAEQYGLSDKEEVFTAALFQDMGMLAIYTTIRDEYMGTAGGTDHSELSVRELDAFGFTHTTVGAELARKWCLPENITQAIDCHHEPERAKAGDLDMVRAVSLGTRVAEALSAKSSRKAVREIESKTASWFPKKRMDISVLLERVNEASRELASLFDTDIGDLKDVQRLLAQAEERGLEHQISLQRQTESLEREVMTDGLTGLENRKGFNRALNGAYRGFRERGDAFAVLFVDADRFKDVNDVYGHMVGDDVLTEVAHRIRRVVGEAGTVCRYGGEEFGVVLPGHTALKAATLAERVRMEVSTVAIDIRHHGLDLEELGVSVSIGVSATDAGPIDRVLRGAQVVSEADVGVYLAKESGRDCVRVWTPDLKTPLMDGIGVSEGNAGASVDGAVIPEGDGTVHRILLIEDDDLAATLLTTLLQRKASVDVVWLKSGHEACEFFERCIERQERGCDLVVCDLYLPGCTGFDVFRSFRSKGLNRQLPFYLMTAHASEATIAEANKLGIQQCIGKSTFTKNINKWIGLMTNPVLKAA